MSDSDITRLIRDAVDGALAGGVKFTNQRAQALFEGIVQLVFRAVILTGSFRLPAGYGSFVIKMKKPTRRRINGVLIDVPALSYVRYSEGDAVRAALGKRDHYPARKNPPKSVI